ncbi:MAG: DPP IV N-terminal domain-containing protein, partial [Muribaculaceae bacterium]|nr:DPP IV N-terminal domain-containing protein [Muribaculaceae bacterium]
MKRIICPATIILAAIAAVAAPPRIDVAGIQQYVYPDNKPKAVPAATYMPDGETYLRLSDDRSQIISYSTATGKQDAVVLDRTKTREEKMGPVEGFTISPDGSKLLVWTDSEPIYRRSSKANYYIFDIKRNILRPLSKTGKKQQAPLFSPDSRMVAFVIDNNISVRKYDYDTEIAITTDGAHGKIINGVPDWTYEEEFATACSMTWAPDNQTLCYLKYNEADVPQYNLALYEGTCDPNTEYALYPGLMTYKYPVAGEPN